MSLLSYKMFLTIVEYMNFRQAADQLNLTPSAVSHCISTMEEELGFPLFVRKKNKISLTSDAQILLPHIRQVLRSEETLRLVAEEIKGLQRGTVRLGCFSTVCISWVPQILQKFHDQYPGLEVELFQGSYTDIARWLENGSIDIGFISVSGAGNIPVEALYQDPLLGVVPKGFHTEQKGMVTIEELSKLRYVQPLENGDADSLKLIETQGSTMSSVCHVIDDLSILKMIETGMGACILPKLLVDAYNVNVDAYPLQPPAFRTIGLAFYDPSKSIPAVEKLAMTIREMFR